MQKDIWRRGGLDSISEDEEEDEEEEEEEEDALHNSNKMEGFVRQGNGACPSERRIGANLPLHKRPNHFTPDNWRGFRRKSNDWKTRANHVEKEPLISCEERKHPLSRQCAVEVNVPVVKPSPHLLSPDSRLNEILSNQSLEWEQENLSLHDSADSEPKNDVVDRLMFVPSAGVVGGVEDGGISSESPKSSVSSSSERSIHDSPELSPKYNSDFSKHLYISSDNENLDEISHCSSNILESIPELREVERQPSPTAHDDDSDDASADNEELLEITEFENPTPGSPLVRHSSPDMSQPRNCDCPVLFSPFHSGPLDLSGALSDTGSVRRGFAELPFQRGRSPASRQNLGESLSSGAYSPPGSFDIPQSSQDSFKLGLSASESPEMSRRRLLPPSLQKLDDDFLNASFPGPSGQLTSGGSCEGTQLHGPLRRALTEAKSTASSSCSLSETSPAPRRRRKASSAMQPPTIFAPLVVNATNPYKDFVPPPRESEITCDCEGLCSSPEQMANGYCVDERSLETAGCEADGNFGTGIEEERVKGRTSDEELNKGFPFAPTGDRDSELDERENISSTLSVSPVTTDFFFASQSAISDFSPERFAHQDFSGYEQEPQPFLQGTSGLAGLSGACSTHSVKHERNAADLLSPTRPMRTSFSEPHLSKVTFPSARKHPSRNRECDENSNIMPRAGLEDRIPEDTSQFTTQQLEDIFRDVSNTKEAMEKLHTILSSPEPDICSELADTRQTVKRLDKQIWDLNKEVASLSGDVKAVLQILRGLKNDEAVTKVAQ